MSTTPKSKTLRRSLSTPYQKGRRSSSGCFAPFKSPAASSNTKNDSVTNKEETSEKVKQQIPCKLNTQQPDDKVTLANEVVQMHQKCQQLDQEIEELRKSLISNKGNVIEGKLKIVASLFLLEVNFLISKKNFYQKIRSFQL
ncbi:uncharacterized protein [Clytia hemisphaerica]|uniref:uncharacterized protein n=1 Tax=Clytia hemisphaerica TaxID=252671 RepID=UPI0034D5451B